MRDDQKPDNLDSPDNQGECKCQKEKEKDVLARGVISRLFIVREVIGSAQAATLSVGVGTSR